MKFLLVPVFFVACSLTGNAQEYSYPNEVKGLELFSKGSWKSLIPYVSTKADVRKILGRGCENGCDYGADWRVEVVYVSQYQVYSQREGKTVPCVSESLIGLYSGLVFYPKKRIGRLVSKFGRPFRKAKEQLFDSYPPSTTYHYSDSSGLTYTIYGEDLGDFSFRKGDLLSVSYGISEAGNRKIRSRLELDINC